MHRHRCLPAGGNRAPASVPEPARVIRVQAHELPLLRPQWPRPRPDAGRDSHAPEVVDKPGAVDQRRIGGREPLSRGPGEPRDASRVASEPWALEVGSVAEPGEGLVEGGFVAEQPPRRRLSVDNRRPQIIWARDRQQLCRRVQEDRGDRGIERAPPTIERPSGPRPRRPRQVRTSPPRSRRPRTAPPRRPHHQPGRPRPPRKLGREQARAHGFARRMPPSEIARHRQRRNHAADPHLFMHGRKSRECLISLQAAPAVIPPLYWAADPEHPAQAGVGSRAQIAAWVTEHRPGRGAPR
jgi:hypothetical protein